MFRRFGLLDQILTNVSRKLRLRASSSGTGMSCHVMSCHVMYMSCHVCHVHVSCHVMSVMYMSCHVMSCTCVMSCHACHVHVLCHVMSVMYMSCHVMVRRTWHDMTMPRWSHTTARWSHATAMEPRCPVEQHVHACTCDAHFASLMRALLRTCCASKRHARTHTHRRNRACTCWLCCSRFGSGSGVWVWGRRHWPKAIKSAAACPVHMLSRRVKLSESLLKKF